MEINSLNTSRPAKAAAVHTSADAALDAARSMETLFLSQMLKSAGLAKPAGMFGGGAGEEQFASLLVDEQAKLFVAMGGIGLSERLARAMGGQGA